MLHVIHILRSQLKTAWDRVEGGKVIGLKNSRVNTNSFRVEGLEVETLGLKSSSGLKSDN
jgi:hypothetical protein